MLRAMWRAVMDRLGSDGLLVMGLVGGWFALQFLVLPGFGVST